jgi:hypothetical protein
MTRESPSGGTDNVDASHRVAAVQSPRGDSRFSRRGWLARLAGATILPAIAGCGYNLGAPYNPEVRTVHVPIFRSDSRRRGYEYQLTEAVQTKIKSRTPFRVVKEEDADTRLLGKITSVEKRMLGISGGGDARELQTDVAVEITWEDLRSGEVMQLGRVPAPEIVKLQAQGDFAPEVGQSLATADREAIERLATRIVEMMEEPW